MFRNNGLFGFRQKYRMFVNRQKEFLTKTRFSNQAREGSAWAGLLLFGLFGGGILSLYLYFKKRMKEHEVKIEGAGLPRIGGPFTLVDHNGIPRTSASFHGEWTMIYFGFTYCPDICPTELTKISNVIKTMERDYNMKILPVFISVDPWRDSVEQIRTYLKDFHPRFVGLTGTPEQIQKVTKSYRVYYSKPPSDNSTDYLVDHSIFTYLLDREGNFVDYFGVNKDEDQIIDALKQHIGKREKIRIPLRQRLKQLLAFKSKN